MMFNVTFPESTEAEKYFRISFGDVDSTQARDTWIFYPDREKDKQIGDIIDGYEYSSGNVVRDKVENVQQKVVNGLSLSAIRDYDTGDTEQDTVYDCSKTNKWTWSYGHINHTTASNFTITDDTSKQGVYFYVSA